MRKQLKKHYEKIDRLNEELIGRCLDCQVILNQAKQNGSKVNEELIRAFELLVINGKVMNDIIKAMNGLI